MIHAGPRTRHRLYPRALLTVLYTMLLTLLVGPVAQVGVAPETSPATADGLEELRKQAEESKEELEKATEEYTQREEELEEAQGELVETLHELQQTELRLAELREPLVELANTMYKQPDVGVMGMMTSESIDEDLKAESHVSKLSGDREAILEEANALREEQAELTGSAQELQSQTQMERVELEDDLEALRAKAEENTQELTSALEERGMSVDAYMAGVECDPEAGAAAADYPNGLLPEEALCDIHVDGHQLRADAAVEFLELNQAYTEHFGEPMCVTSSYRDLPNQRRVFAEQPPGYAAVPGTSNHGLGQAIDLCGGVQNFRSEQFNWLEANGGEYGWFHPDWAKSNPFEPWHWEYKG